MTLLAVLVAVNIATNRIPDAAYLPVALVCVVAMVGFSHLVGLSAAELHLSPGSLVPGALWAAAAVATVVGFYIVGLMFGATRAGLADTKTGSLPGHVVVWRALVVVPLGTVLLEETAFRGVLLGLLQRDWSTLWSVVTCSALFGIWHVLPSVGRVADNPLARDRLGTGLFAEIRFVGFSVVTTGFAGIIFCLLVVGSGSLIPAVAFHWATNGVGYLVAWSLVRRHPTADDVAEAERHLHLDLDGDGDAGGRAGQDLSSGRLPRSAARRWRRQTDG